MGFNPYIANAATIAPGSVGTAQLADRSVTAVKVALDTLTLAEIADSAVSSGTWTPTTAIITNLDSVTPFQGNWLRVGDSVTFGVRITVDPTAAGTINFGITLPVASNFSAIGQANAGSNASGAGGADPTNDRIDFFATAPSGTAFALVINGSYRVL